MYDLGSAIFEIIVELFSYVGADLLSLCREAALHAVTRIFELTGDSTSQRFGTSCDLT